MSSWTSTKRTSNIIATTQPKLRTQSPKLANKQNYDKRALLREIFVFPALLQKLVGDVCLILGRKFWREFCGIFWTHKIKAQHLRGKFRSIFRERIHAAKKQSFVPTSFCRCASLQKIFVLSAISTAATALWNKAARHACAKLLPHRRSNATKAENCIADGCALGSISTILEVSSPSSYTWR